MTLNFNETCILNQSLDVDNKEDYLKKLIAIQENTTEPELIEAIDSLVDKITSLTFSEFKQLVKDRNSNNIFTFPPYCLWDLI